MKKRMLLFLCTVFTTAVSLEAEACSGLYFSVNKNYAIQSDSLSLDSLFQIANKILSQANELKPKALELKNLYSGYKAKAGEKKCTVALKEIEDALKMAEVALKDCEEVGKLVEKALKSKKPKDVQKLVDLASKKYKNAKYYTHESENRKKEVEFELKGC
jgi:hypothetical protein